MRRFYRRLSPPRAARPTDYRPFLRYEFRFICAYCGIHEDEHGDFEVDHFKPTSKFPELERDYSNLYYVCSKCNNFKRAFWPSSDDEAVGLRFVDPCEDDLLYGHAELLPSGILKAKSKAGEFTIGHLALNRPRLVRWRRKRREERERHYEAVAQFRGVLASFDEVLREIETGEGSLADLAVTQLKRSRADIAKQLECVMREFGPVRKPIDED